MLSLEGVCAGYGLGLVLSDVSLHVGEGEVVCLLGRNGAGKTTTLKSIIGLVAASSGRVQFLGSDIAGLPTYEICRRGIGYVPEDRRIFPDLTVMENLEVGREASRGKQADWTIARVLDLFGLLKPLAGRRGKLLSGGEQRMLAIARALLGNPKLLLLDEPSEGLAPLVVQALREHIRTLKESGLSILLSEQNMAFASALSDRVYVIDKGQIQIESTFARLEASQELKRMYLTV